MNINKLFPVVMSVSAIALGCVGLLGAYNLLMFITGPTKEERNARSCQENLQIIETASQWYLFRANLQPDTKVTFNDLIPDYLKIMPVCPAGSDYTPGFGYELPRCNAGIKEHNLEELSCYGIADLPDDCIPDEKKKRYYGKELR